MGSVTNMGQWRKDHEASSSTSPYHAVHLLGAESFQLLEPFYDFMQEKGCGALAVACSDVCIEAVSFETVGLLQKEKPRLFGSAPRGASVLRKAVVSTEVFKGTIAAVFAQTDNRESNTKQLQAILETDPNHPFEEEQRRLHEYLERNHIPLPEKPLAIFTLATRLEASVAKEGLMILAKTLRGSGMTIGDVNLPDTVKPIIAFEPLTYRLPR
jgi:hypothetical protein